MIGQNEGGEGHVKSKRIETTLGIALLVSLLAIAGCGSDSGGGVATFGKPRPPSKTSPGSGLFAVDCRRQRAYVPLDSLGSNGFGQVAVINIGANPDITDPRVKTIALTHADTPTGTALDNDHNLILVVSGKTGGQDGFVDIIDEKTNTLAAGSPFSFPTGTQAGHFGQVLYNPTTKLVILATCKSSGCSSGNPLTGFVTFNPVTHVFGTIIPANYPETFSLNSTTNVVMDASDSSSGSGAMHAVDVTGGRACTLTDSNIRGDQDGSSTDSATNITIISNENGTASVLNLNGSTFNPSGTTTPCTLDETNAPNSVLVSGLPRSTAGSAVNGTTHQAFLIEDGVDGVTLIQLPTSPVTGQLIPGNLGTPSISNIPSDPLGKAWTTQGDPYAVAIGECNNTGYAVDNSFNFLVQVDLATLFNTPSNISTALPAGKCAGTTSTVSKCTNGKGVKFFPLPAVL